MTKKTTKKTMKKTTKKLGDVLRAAPGGPFAELAVNRARALGISRQHLSRVANGRCTLSPALAEKMSRIFRIPRHKLAPFLSKRGPGRPRKVERH